jgi:hypothetical protein
MLFDLLAFELIVASAALAATSNTLAALGALLLSLLLHSTALLAAMPTVACAGLTAQAAAAHRVPWPSASQREAAAAAALAKLRSLGWSPVQQTPSALVEALSVACTLSEGGDSSRHLLAGTTWALRCVRVQVPGRRPRAFGWPLVSGRISYDESGEAMAALLRLGLLHCAYAGPWKTVDAEEGTLVLHHALVNQGGARTEVGLFGCEPGANLGGTRVRALLFEEGSLLLHAAASGTKMCLRWERVAEAAIKAAV